MTGIQSKLIEMMREINAACASEGLRYVLSHETAAYAADNDGFTDDRFAFRIIMPIEDIAKLKSYIEKNLSGTRFLESWENNPNLFQLKFFYVDKGSTVIDGGSTEYRAAPGASITIFSARSFMPDEKTLGCEHFTEIYSRAGMKNTYGVLTLKALSRIKNKKAKAKLDSSLGTLNTEYMPKAAAMGVKKAAAYAVKGNFEAAGKPYLNSKNEKCYVYINTKDTELYLPYDLFDNYIEKLFEGEPVRLYSDEEKFLSAIYGKNWQKLSRNPITGTDKINIISDPDIPYADYLEFVKDDEVSFREIVAQKRDLNLWMSNVHNPAVASTQHDFMQIRSSVNRIDIWYNLRNKRAELKQAYEKKDIEVLKQLLSSYLKTTERYRKEKIGFYIDDEIFKYAKLVWEHEAKTTPLKKDYADKIYAMVPELYKNETPDDYFKKRGIKIE